MYHFTYVTKKQAAPLKRELLEFVREIQNEVKSKFTFEIKFVGSSSINMITYDKKGNKGFDFDIDIRVNNKHNLSPEEIRNTLFNAMRNNIKDTSFSKLEDSTCVITIKAISKQRSKIKYGCDFAIVLNNDDPIKKYRRFNKKKGNYTWEERGKDYCIDDKINRLTQNGFRQELRDYYLDKKNKNKDPNKRSRTLLAESVNELYDKKDMEKGDD